MEPPTLTLYAHGLCSKWGFNDGDEPDYLLDYWDEIGVDWTQFDGWHAVLRKLVRSHLVPALEAAGHTVEVYDIETNHNPIRASRIDGQDVDDYASQPPVALRVDEVVVPYEDVAAACGLVKH